MPKIFPSKDNFFCVKPSQTHSTEKHLSPGSPSPLLNYFSGLSQDGQENIFSPKDNFINNQNSRQLSPNFNYSPSSIFNAPKNCDKDLNSFKASEKIENEKSLQEKMGQFLMKTEENNFIRKSSIPFSSSNKEENNNNDEDDDIMRKPLL